MKKFNILVTGVSSIIGYGVIESLRSSEYDCNIVGIDIYDDAVGQQWCDVFELGVMAYSEAFPKFVYDIIVKYDIDLVIPCVEPELEMLMKHQYLYDKLDVKFVLNNMAVYNQLHDKSNAYGFLANKFEQIPTFTGTTDMKYESVAEKLGTSFILKKNISYASRGVITINDSIDFEYWKHKFSDGYICQKKILGEDEYTISVFGTQKGEYVNMIVLSRTLAFDGSTAKARCIEADDDMVHYVDQVCEAISPVGPTNIQLIKDGSKYLLLEVNPRMSSSTSIRNKFGVNEAEMCIEYYLLNKIPEERAQRRGKVVRYIKDSAEYE